MLLRASGLRQRWLGVFLLFPMFIADRAPADGEIRMDVLDVGQGTSVMLTTPNELLLYDSGPGDGEDFDLVQEVLVPAMMRSGHRAPSRIIISHGDMDHAGGLASLRTRFPATRIDASLSAPMDGVTSCAPSAKWEWDGFDFEVLHPSPNLPYLGNDSSCVLSLRSGRVSILLPGDISAVAEEHLMAKNLLPHEILLAPHHGSKSSSTAAFIAAIAPQVAIATTGAGNRFGFPRTEVRQRYQQADVPLWATGECGAIRLEVTANGLIEAHSARRVRHAPWRWPAAENCP